MAKGLHNLQLPDGLVDEGRLTAPDLGLEAEHGVSPLRHKLGHKQGHRRNENDHQRNFPVNEQHKQQRPANGHEAGKQLGKAHKQPVGKLIHVCNDPAHRLPVGMPVQVAEGQLLDVPEGLLPQVPNHLKGNAVVQLSHAPLGQGAGSGGQSNPQENGAQSLKIHLPRAQNAVHAPAHQNGHIELAGHTGQGQKKGPGQEHPVGRNPAQHLSEDRPLLFVTRHGCAPPSGTENGKFPDTQGTAPGAFRESPGPPPGHHPVPESSRHGEWTPPAAKPQRW